MSTLLLAIVFTLGVSGFCSLLEAFILSITSAEIEELKHQRPRIGALLARFKSDITGTSSAILTLNTIANTAGALWIGAEAAKHFPGYVAWVSAMMVLAILFGAEILPKNLGVVYRKALRQYLVHPLLLVRITMWPLSFMAMHSVRLVLKDEEPGDEEKDREIILLAEKSANEGSLTTSERDMISNALSLDNVYVRDIMTPRTVVTALEDTSTVGSVCKDFKNIPFARLPVYRENVDDIIGLVRRRDLLQLYAEDKDETPVQEILSEVPFLPETATALNALQLFLQRHMQFAVVVDEYGSTAGVITMEDVVEHLLGREIYEDSDIAVDMRELARKRARAATLEAGDSNKPSAAPASRRDSGGSSDITSRG